MSLNHESPPSDGEGREVLSFSPLMENVWSEELRGLPNDEVSRLQKRYPTSPEGMASFLRHLFPRHFLQVQQTLCETVQDAWWGKLLRGGVVNIFDIGSGPAVASLAATEMVSRRFRDVSAAVKINYILNDTSRVCLETGTRLLERYFLARRSTIRGSKPALEKGRILTVEEPFPQSCLGIRRFCEEGFRYHFLFAGYVLVPLNENLDLSRSGHQLVSLRQFASSSGAHTVILQDKFHGEVASQMGKLIGASAEKSSSRQQLYAGHRSGQTSTYTYFRSQACT